MVTAEGVAVVEETNDEIEAAATVVEVGAVGAG